jgi:phosphoribosylanthranilate isomerase
VTIVQIFGLERLEDALAAAEIGVEHLGFSVGDPFLPHHISVEEGKRIVARLPAGARTVALFATPDVDLVRRVTEELQPATIQVCWEDDALGPEAEGELRRSIAPVKVIKEIAVGGPETRETAMSAARRYASVADFLILDTAPADIPWIGATGATHDWSISRDIVASSPIPCILAGGLSPENVTAALESVHPWGADSYTHTNDVGPVRRKSHARMQAFYDAVKAFDSR